MTRSASGPETRQHAEDRFLRALMFALGVSKLGYLVFLLAELAREGSAAPTVWSMTAVPSLALQSAVFLVLPFVASPRVLRATALAFAALGFLAILAVLPVEGVAGYPDSVTAPWPLRQVTSYAVAVALVLRARGTWIVVSVMSVIAGGVSLVIAQTPDVRSTSAEFAVTLSVTAAFVLGVLALMRAGRELDRSAEALALVVRAEAAAEAQTAERRRAELLVHDEVLYTLQAAAAHLRAPGTNPEQLATSTLQRLADAQLAEPDLDDDPPVDDATRGPDDFLPRLRMLSAEIAPDAAFRVEGRAGGALAEDVTAAILGAVGEALRNSTRHAGRVGEPVARLVEVRLDGPGVSVRVVDNGRGFVPEHVAPGRLGIARSITDRLRALPGGEAAVTSQPGVGTTVEMSWRPVASARPDTPDVPTLFGLTPRVRAVLGASLIVGYVALAVVEGGDARLGSSGWLTSGWLVVGLLLAAFAFALVAVLGSSRHPLSRVRVGIVIALTTAIAAAPLDVSPLDEAPLDVEGFPPWYLRAAATVLVLLIIRGRPGAAWVALALGTAVFLGRGITADADGSWLLGVVLQMAMTIVVAHVIVAIMARATVTIAGLRADERYRIGRSELRAVAARRRAIEFTEIRQLVEPTLRSIAGGAPGAAEESALIERELRDLLRARRLAIEPLTSAVRAARRRGAEVVLLDDGEALGLDDFTERAVAWSAELLARVDAESVTVRLSRGDHGGPRVTFFADGDVAPRVFDG